MLQALAAEVARCRKCPHLAATRTQTVFADGSPTARLMFIGEAPGADEDRTGEPFVGRAGQLLTDMITKGMGLTREDVYIANILKCRPPENRDPAPEEVGQLPAATSSGRSRSSAPSSSACWAGSPPATLLETALPHGPAPGQVAPLPRHPHASSPITPPTSSATRPAKKEAWEDLQMLMNAMGLAVPEAEAGSG